MLRDYGTFISKFSSSEWCYGGSFSFMINEITLDTINIKIWVALGRMYIFVRKVDFLLHNWGLGVVAILGLWNHAYYMHKNESTNVNVTVPNWHILSPRALFPPLGKLCTTSSDSALF